MWFIETIPILEDNYSFLLGNRETRDLIVIDPGEARPIEAFLKKENLNLTAIFNTHHHSDHVAGNAALIKVCGKVPVMCLDIEQRIPQATCFLEEGLHEVAGLSFKVKKCLGHTNSQAVYYFPSLNAVFSGDVLFNMGCGRLFEGNARDLWNALEWFKSLPESTQVYCGHEYTQANLRFLKAVFPELHDYQVLEKELEFRLKHEQKTVPFHLGQDKIRNPFFRYDDRELRSFLKTFDPVEYLAELRRLKNAFS